MSLPCKSWSLGRAKAVEISRVLNNQHVWYGVVSVSARMCFCISGSGCLGSCETSGWEMKTLRTACSFQFCRVYYELSLKQKFKQGTFKVRVFEYSVYLMEFGTLESI